MKPFFPEMKLFSNEFKFPESADFYVGAALGLADIREHFDLNVTDLANGKIEYEGLYTILELNINCAFIKSFVQISKNYKEFSIPAFDDIQYFRVK